MRYYVTADIHGYYSEFMTALTEAGFFTDEEPHKLIILGDLMDRGKEAVLLQNFIIKLMKENAVILIRGNHEDLFRNLVEQDNGRPLSHHLSNGTFNTALQLTGFRIDLALDAPLDFAKASMETPYYKEIMPSMLDYFETQSHVFVHGWIPCIREYAGYCSITDWRNAANSEWEKARWYNGMDAVLTSDEEKTVVCGHWHCSYGHSKYEGRGSEFGEDADFTPYYAPGIIALDACTAHSKRVNCIVIADQTNC